MISIPRSLVTYEVHDGEIVPVYFDQRDMPWLRELIEVFQALDGRPRRDLDERLRSGARVNGPPPRSRDLQHIARHVLKQIYKTRVVAAVAPRAARAALFAAATTQPGPVALNRTAARMNIAPADLEAALFADLPEARRVAAPADCPSPESLALVCNTAIIRALMRSAVEVRIAARGNTRAIVRQARLAGLMVEIVPGAGRPDGCELRITGPLAALAQTTRYGNALARFVPALPWCAWFRLEARCRPGSSRDVPLRLVLTQGSPIEPGPEPRRFDSALEARFARNFVRATSAWSLLREPEPIEAGGVLVFPDFEIRLAARPENRWWLEIVGFWTEEYLSAKLARLRAAKLDRLVLCIDRARACTLGPGPLPGFDNVVWFGRDVDVAAVLEVIGGS